MTDEQFSKFMEMQFAQLCMLQGIFNCIQAANIAAGRSPGTFNMKDAKKILDSAGPTLKSA